MVGTYEEGVGAKKKLKQYFCVGIRLHISEVLYNLSKSATIRLSSQKFVASSEGKKKETQVWIGGDRKKCGGTGGDCLSQNRSWVHKFS